MQTQNGGSVSNELQPVPKVNSGDDVAAVQNGGSVILATSSDERHPVSNVNSGDASFWMSTGSFPQELIVQLRTPTALQSVRVSGTALRKIRVEGCSGESPGNFIQLAQADVENARVQDKALACERVEPLRFVKLVVQSGWHDFISVHMLECIAA
jgi:heat shock protein beta-11